MVESASWHVTQCDSFGSHRILDQQPTQNLHNVPKIVKKKFEVYLMRPTGNPQVIHHPQHLNLDPQGPVATGEPDPRVTLPADFLCGFQLSY